MTVALGHPVVVGNTVVAALVRNSISNHGLSRHVLFTGCRCPVALLVRRGDTMVAFTLAGDRLETEDVEDLCPGAIKQFLSAYSA